MSVSTGRGSAEVARTARRVIADYIAENGEVLV
jgi:hypothetical protein